VNSLVARLLIASAMAADAHRCRADRLGPDILGISVIGRGGEPDQVTKQTVIVLRSSPTARAGRSSGAPHAKQNRAISGFACPHAAHAAIPAAEVNRLLARAAAATEHTGTCGQ
jgi:hypothetical protein